ncbi:MAG: hypothetical protein FWF08_02335 [Oscillospiraceae bacterium]|nr:hypothetical protein [Oscillospiraceae bacterium]
MLGKLIKNDMRSAWQSVSKIYFAAGAIALFVLIAMLTGFTMGKMVASILLFAVATIAIVVTIFTAIIEFNKVMFGDRGYLTNTLPVSSINLLFSKWMTSMIWVLLSFLFLAVSMFFIFYLNSGGEAASILDMMISTMPEMGLPSRNVLVVYIVFYVVKIILQTAVFVALTFFAVILSNTKYLQKFGMLGSIAVILVLFIVISTGGTYLTKLVNVAIIINSDMSLALSANKNEISMMTFSGGASVALTKIYFMLTAAFFAFIASAELLEKKVNVR